MNPEEFLALLAKALKINSSRIHAGSRQEDFEEWDSLGHLNILVQLDKATDGKASLITAFVEAKSVADFLRILAENNLLKNS